MQKAWEFSNGIEEIAPPTHLRNAILQPVPDQVAVNQAMSATPAPTPPLTERVKTQWFSWSRAIAATAAAIALAMSIENYRLRNALQAARPDGQAAALTYQLQGAKPGTAATALVIVNPEKLEAQLTTTNLPPLPPGKVYALWTVVKQDAPVTVDIKGAVLTATFTVDTSGKASQTFLVPPIYRSEEIVTNVAITVEDAAAPQKHIGSPIVITKS
jgi:hypothetical protein